MIEVQWLTTAPSGRSHTHGADDGQTGWRLHAVPGAGHEPCSVFNTRRSLCGILPRTGWGLDMFIERRCKRCEAKLASQT
jgi:hypothetical protein